MFGRIGKTNIKKNNNIDTSTNDNTTYNNAKNTEKVNEINLEDNKLAEINELNKKLKKAIKEENYEEAAILRDKIKELEGEN